MATCFVQLVGAPNLGLGDTRSNPVEAWIFFSCTLFNKYSFFFQFVVQGKLFRIDRNTKGPGCFFHLSFTQTEVRLYIKRILKFSHLGWFFNVSAIFLFQFQDITDRLLQSMEASNQSVDNLLLEIDQSIAASRDTMRYAHNSDVKCPPQFPPFFLTPPSPPPPSSNRLHMWNLSQTYLLCY